MYRDRVLCKEAVPITAQEYNERVIQGPTGTFEFIACYRAAANCKVRELVIARLLLAAVDDDMRCRERERSSLGTEPAHGNAPLLSHQHNLCLQLQPARG